MREEIRIQMQKVTKEVPGIATIRIPPLTDAIARGLLGSNLRGTTTIRTLIDETTEMCQTRGLKILAKLN